MKRKISDDELQRLTQEAFQQGRVNRNDEVLLIIKGYLDYYLEIYYDNKSGKYPGSGDNLSIDSIESIISVLKEIRGSLQ